MIWGHLDSRSISELDGVKPNINKYIKSFASFMEVNGYPVRIEDNEKDRTISFHTRHGINYKYSLFCGEIIKMTLAGLAEITREEMTNSSVYLECKVLQPSERSF